MTTLSPTLSRETREATVPPQAVETVVVVVEDELDDEGMDVVVDVVWVTVTVPGPVGVLGSHASPLARRITATVLQSIVCPFQSLSTSVKKLPTVRS